MKFNGIHSRHIVHYICIMYHIPHNFEAVLNFAGSCYIRQGADKSSMQGT